MQTSVHREIEQARAEAAQTMLALMLAWLTANAPDTAARFADEWNAELEAEQ